ncbi:hypothetical protein [Devriesea agamarum]|uniref:hypothetical protein n=1 Tax=Devriesea agamarum TaxID=472569 RepID=UPI00071C9E1D|nr:hypothetical protein [Devriesea agamarum]
MRTEPVLSTATITSAAAAIIALLIAFGIPITEDQKVALIGVIAVIAPLIVAITRRYVTPNVNVVEHARGGEVIAGPANEAAPTGTVIRPTGSHAFDAELDTGN